MNFIKNKVFSFRIDEPETIDICIEEDEISIATIKNFLKNLDGSPYRDKRIQTNKKEL
jgi:hypothetical protein